MEERNQEKAQETTETREKEKESTILSKGINDNGVEELIFSTGEGVEKSEKKKKKKPKGKKR